MKQRFRMLICGVCGNTLAETKNDRYDDICKVCNSGIIVYQDTF